MHRQPRVNTRLMKRMATHREQPDHIPSVELRQADRTLGPAFPFLQPPRGREEEGGEGRDDHRVETRFGPTLPGPRIVVLRGPTVPTGGDGIAEGKGGEVAEGVAEEEDGEEAEKQEEDDEYRQKGRDRTHQLSRLESR